MKRRQVHRKEEQAREFSGMLGTMGLGREVCKASASGMSGLSDLVALMSQPLKSRHGPAAPNMCERGNWESRDLFPERHLRCFLNLESLRPAF